MIQAQINKCHSVTVAEETRRAKQCGQGRDIGTLTDCSCPTADGKVFVDVVPASGVADKLAAYGASFGEARKRFEANTLCKLLAIALPRLCRSSRSS